MDVRGLTWELKSKDLISKSIEKVDKKVDKLKENMASATEKAQSGLKGISDSTNKASKKLDSMSSKTKKLSASAAVLAGIGIKTAADFEKKLTFAKVQANMTNKEMQDLGKTIRKMDKRSTSLELLDAAGVYASAGLIKDEIVGVMKATEQISRISGNSEVASDMMLTSNVAFNVDLSDEKAVQKVGDRFAKASDLAKLEMEEINETIKEAQGSFKSMNMNIDDSASSIVLLAKAGYVGSRAGTMLNATYTDLINKAEDGSITLGKTKVSLYDANKRMKQLPVIMEEVAEATKNMSEEQRNTAISNIFGSGSMKAVKAFLSQGAEAYQSYADEIMNAEGDLERKYNEMGNTASERWAKTKSSLMDAAVGLGTGMLPALEILGDGIGKLADKFSDLDENTQKVIGLTVLGTAALSPGLKLLSLATGGIGKFASGLNRVIGVLPKALSVASTFGKGLLFGGKAIVSFAGTFGASVVSGFAAASKATLAFVAANPIALVAAGVIAAGVLVYKNWDKVKAAGIKLKESISSSWSSLLSSTKEKWGSVKSTINGVIDSIKAKWASAKEFLSKPIKGAINVVGNGVQKAKNLVQGSYAVGATEIRKDHIAQVHEGEAILPKSLAEEYRALGGTRDALPEFKNENIINHNKTVKNNSSSIATTNNNIVTSYSQTDSPRLEFPLHDILSKLNDTRQQKEETKSTNFNPTININVAGNADSNTVKDIEKVVNNQINLIFRKLNLQQA